MLKDLLLSVSSHISQSKTISKSLLVLPLSDSDEESSKFLTRSSSFEKNEPPVILTKVTPRDYWDDIENNKTNSLPTRCRKNLSFSPKRGIKSPAEEVDPLRPINLLVVGDENVGKSALTVRFITKRYIGEYMKGKQQTYSCYSPQESKERQKINFQDEPSCQKTFQNLASQFREDNLAWADGIIIVYDVGDVKSFEYAKEAISLLVRSYDDRTLGCLPWFKPVLMLGNKKDIIRRRRVHEHNVREAAKNFPHWVSCKQVSAAEDYDSVAGNINELIGQIREIRGLSRVFTKEKSKCQFGTTLKSNYAKPKPDLCRSSSEGVYVVCKS